MSTPTPNTPSLWEVIHHLVNEMVASWFTAIPGVITSYDPTTQSCSVQPVLKSIRRGEDGENVVSARAIINSVPVVFPGGGGYRVVFPLEEGDTVMLVMSTFSLDRWKAKGGLVDPGDERRWDPSDAVAFPLLNDFTRAWANVPTDGMSIGLDDGPTIKVTATDIQAGGTSSLALFSAVNDLKTIFNNWAVTAGDGGGALKTALAAWNPGGTAVLKGG
jgi:hypothetical protein